MPTKKTTASRSPSPRRSTAVSKGSFTVPGMTDQQGLEVAAILQERLNAVQDLHLTLKHVHWNVVGPNFIAVHEMIDPQVDAARAMADEIAERIATLGSSPLGTPGAIVAQRSWNEYSLGRASTVEHLAALDLVYQGVISAHREAIAATETVDPVSQDMLIGEASQLELFHWFVRAHLEGSDGTLATAGQTTETGAARAAAKRTRKAG